MFDAALNSVGNMMESVFRQGALLFDRFISTSDTEETLWYLFIFSAFVFYLVIFKFLRGKFK